MWFVILYDKRTFLFLIMEALTHTYIIYDMQRFDIFNMYPYSLQATMLYTAPTDSFTIFRQFTIKMTTQYPEELHYQYRDNTDYEKKDEQ